MGVNILNTEVIYSGYNKLEKMFLSNKQSKLIERELLRCRDGVCALIYNTVSDKYLLVKQWRPSLEDDMIELVAGSIEKDESPLQAVKKEVYEETGYDCDKIEFISSLYVSPGTISEKIYLYYIEVSTKISDLIGNPDEDEELELLEFTKEELFNLDILDAKSVLGINWLKFRS